MTPNGVAQRALFSDESLRPVPPRKQKEPAATTLLLRAYTEVVGQELGMITNKRDAARHLGELTGQQVTPEEVCAAVRWEVSGWPAANGQPRHYALSKVLPAVQAWRANGRPAVRAAASPAPAAGQDFEVDTAGYLEEETLW